MRIHLVTMPWQPIELPSLQVGLLHSLLDRTRPHDEVREFHGSLRWAEFLLERSQGALRPGDHVAVGSESIFDGLGDWVFSGVLYKDPEWGVAQLKEYATRRGTDISTATAMRVHAAEFIDESASAILGEEPDAVGFTSTFMQNISSLALAAELKRRRPGLTVVFGGSNCDGPMGHALHRNHRFVDHVVRGEGEYALPALLAHVEAGTAPADVPGLCWWDGPESRANDESRRTVAPGDIPSPDYDLWQAAIDASPLAEYVHPKLVVEGARGCWWGEKHHCTFCGLNGSAMTFRAKTGSRLWDEVDRLVRRHRILDVVTVDNIIDMAYFKDFLPLAADSDWDLRMHYEVKSNLTPEQLELLARAGSVHIQPGIESLNNKALELMDKGVGAARNIRTLRECENHSLTCSWNYLYGFPGRVPRTTTPSSTRCPRSSTSSRPAAPTASNWSGSAPTSPTPRWASTSGSPPRCTAMSMTCPRNNWPIWSTSSTPRPPGSAAGPRHGSRPRPATGTPATPPRPWSWNSPRKRTARRCSSSTTDGTAGRAAPTG